jgi:hypothetical protein
MVDTHDPTRAPLDFRVEEPRLPPTPSTTMTPRAAKKGFLTKTKELFSFNSSKKKAETRQQRAQSSATPAAATRRQMPPVFDRSKTTPVKGVEHIYHTDTDARQRAEQLSRMQAADADAVCDDSPSTARRKRIDAAVLAAKQASDDATTGETTTPALAADAVTSNQNIDKGIKNKNAAGVPVLPTAPAPRAAILHSALGLPTTHFVRGERQPSFLVELFPAKNDSAAVAAAAASSASSSASSAPRVNAEGKHKRGGSSSSGELSANMLNHDHYGSQGFLGNIVVGPDKRTSANVFYETDQLPSSPQTTGDGGAMAALMAAAAAEAAEATTAASVSDKASGNVESAVNRPKSSKVSERMCGNDLCRQCNALSRRLAAADVARGGDGAPQITANLGVLGVQRALFLRRRIDAAKRRDDGGDAADAAVLAAESETRRLHLTAWTAAVGYYAVIVIWGRVQAWLAAEAADVSGNASSNVTALTMLLAAAAAGYIHFSSKKRLTTDGAAD